MTLLSGVILIYIAGGVSGAGVYSNDVWWVFICLFLTVASWLWAPFIFNPYQPRGCYLQVVTLHESHPIGSVWKRPLDTFGS